MAKVKRVSASEPVRRTRRALDPEARENQMISLAENLAEKQLMDGTASSQVITHYLKLGTAKYKLELERTKQENALLQAKTEMTQSYKNIEKLYSDAMKAFSSYSGHGGYDENSDDYGDDGYGDY